MSEPITEIKEKEKTTPSYGGSAQDAMVFGGVNSPMDSQGTEISIEESDQQLAEMKSRDSHTGEKVREDGGVYDGERIQPGIPPHLSTPGRRDLDIEEGPDDMVLQIQAEKIRPNPIQIDIGKKPSIKELMSDPEYHRKLDAKEKQRKSNQKYIDGVGTFSHDLTNGLAKSRLKYTTRGTSTELMSELLKENNLTGKALEKWEFEIQQKIDFIENLKGQMDDELERTGEYGFLGNAIVDGSDEGIQLMVSGTLDVLGAGTKTSLLTDAVQVAIKGHEQTADMMMTLLFTEDKKTGKRIDPRIAAQYARVAGITLTAIDAIAMVAGHVNKNAAKAQKEMRDALESRMIEMATDPKWQERVMDFAKSTGKDFSAKAVIGLAEEFMKATTVSGAKGADPNAFKGHSGLLTGKEVKGIVTDVLVDSGEKTLHSIGSDFIGKATGNIIKTDPDSDASGFIEAGQKLMDVGVETTIEKVGGTAAEEHMDEGKKWLKGKVGAEVPGSEPTENESTEPEEAGVEPAEMLTELEPPMEDVMEEPNPTDSKVAPSGMEGVDDVSESEGLEGAADATAPAFVGEAIGNMIPAAENASMDGGDEEKAERLSGHIGYITTNHATTPNNRATIESFQGVRMFEDMKRASEDQQLLAALEEFTQNKNGGNANPEILANYIKKTVDRVLPGQTHVYVDAEVLRNFMKDAPEHAEVLNMSVRDLRQQLSGTAQLGGDIEIPIGRYYAMIGTSPAGEILGRDLRLSPGMMSSNEVKADRETMIRETELVSQRTQDANAEEEQIDRIQGLFQNDGPSEEKTGRKGGRWRRGIKIALKTAMVVGTARLLGIPVRDFVTSTNIEKLFKRIQKQPFENRKNEGFTPRGDVPTFFGEMAGTFFESLQSMSKIPAVDKFMEKQFDSLNDHFKVDSISKLKPSHFKQFSKEYMNYLKDGLPSFSSEELENTFIGYGDYLLETYRRGIEMDPDETQFSREVLDVMEALREQEVSVGVSLHELGLRPVYENRTQMGVSEEEWERHNKLPMKIENEAKRRRIGVSLKRIESRKSPEYKRHRSEVEGKVRVELEAGKDFQAKRFLATGMAAIDGEFEGIHQLNDKLVRAILRGSAAGKKLIAKLPRGKNAITTKSDDGLDPETVAERFGFSSGKDLLHAVLDLTKDNIKKRIESRVSEWLENEGDDDSYDAILNDDAVTMLESEIRAAAGDEYTFSMSAEFLEKLAHQTISRKSITLVKPARHAMEMRRQWWMARKAALKGDRKKVLTARRIQLLNLYMYRAATHRIENREDEPEPRAAVL